MQEGRGYCTLQDAVGGLAPHEHLGMRTERVGSLARDRVSELYSRVSMVFVRRVRVGRKKECVCVCPRIAVSVLVPYKLRTSIDLQPKVEI